MSYEEKGTWVYLVVSVSVFAGYVAVLLGRVDGAPVTDVEFAPLLVWAIGTVIAATVVVRILVEIARPSENYRVDPRDKEINRLGDYVSGGVLSVGMLVPLALTLRESDHFWIANSMYGAFFVSAVVGSVVKLVAYRRGLQRW